MSDPADPATIRAEVQRLAPWYYAFDLGGVRTDETPAGDGLPHRRVRLPDRARELLAGKRVLDAACNEGGYAFSALECGASSVDAFDVRPINVEKARFVARVLGHDAVHFHVASCDSWLSEHPDEVYDYVFLCGLLYHLPEPWRTIEQYCARAREGVFVTCVLAGGDDGYEPFFEEENIAANERPGEASMMPRTTRTLIDEFAKHRFYPRYVAESRSRRHWGGCSLWFHDCRRAPARVEVDLDSDRAALHVVPIRWGENLLDVEVVAYNWQEAEAALEGSVRVRGENGEELRVDGPEPLVLPARAPDPERSPSESVGVPLSIELPDGAARLCFELREARTGEPVAARSLCW